MAITWAAELSQSSQQEVSDEEIQSPPEKVSKVSAATGRSKYLLYQRNHATLQPPTSGTSASIRQEMKIYLNLQHDIKVTPDGDLVEIDPVKFWNESTITRDMPALAKLANMVLSVPASSAAVERVFSHGGIIFRPHRRRLTDEHLSQLIYLKCNRLHLS